ncbi:MAG: hypothetical protein NT160_05755, partial [Actinobacteria bacterium]|nr:hypothetical protein [Actinomycetota bacterium]
MVFGLLVLKAPSPARATTSPSHRILITGDSIEHQASTYETSMLAATGQVSVKMVTVPGIAFCALWPMIKIQLASFKPDVVVIELTGYERSPCAKQYGVDHSDAWFSAFGQLLEQGLMAMAAAGVSQVEFDAGPTTKRPERIIWTPRLLKLYDVIAAAHPGLVTRISPALAVEAQGGKWTKALPCLAAEIDSGACPQHTSANPGTITVRSPDNFHLCTQAPVDPYSAVCPSYSSGAFRYAAATVAPLISSWG